MKSLNFDSGIREYAVNGDDSRVVRVNITDLNLGKRIEDLSAEFDRMREKYREIGTPNAQQLFALDRDVRAMLNAAFDSDICTPAFGNANCCSPVADGKMLCEGFVDALLAQIKADIAEIRPAVAQPHPAVQAYLDDVQPVMQPVIPGSPVIGQLTPEQKRALLAQLLS